MNRPLLAPTRPYLRRPVPKPFDLRRKPPYPPNPQRDRCPRERSVTVCISIACDCFHSPMVPKFILIADQMISTVTSSTQVGIKIRWLSKGWYVMYAGTDVSMVETIIAKAQNSLAARPTIARASEVSQEMRNAYQVTREQKVRDAYLSSFHWDINQFLQDGRRLLGEANFTNLLFQIEQFDLGCSFLVCGFDSQNATNPMFFEVDNPGVATPQMATGHAAIGSGAPNAISYLDWRGQSWSLSLEESVYNGVAAKALAEKAIGVGPETSTIGLILERGQESGRPLTAGDLQPIRDIWSNEEANVRPPNIKERVAIILGL